MYHNLLDSHIHSVNSPDGVHSLMYLAEHTEEKALIGLAVTDHVECLRFDELGYRTRIAQSAVDTAKARVAFRHKMTITFGVELGVARAMYDVADYIINLYPFDFVLGACHISRRGEELAYIDYSAFSDKELDKLVADYFEDMLELARWNKFDCLAHMTYPMRCAMRNNNISIPTEPYREQIEELLCILVETGKALELNTSGLRGPLKDTLPPKWVIKRYKELGGQLITIGSDAHKAEYIGEGINHAMQMLADVGYEYFAFYRQRKPIMMRIV